MSIHASSHHALPLPWAIILMVLVGAVAFGLVTWAIPRFLTGKSPVWGRAAWRNEAWQKRKKGNRTIKARNWDYE